MDNRGGGILSVECFNEASEMGFETQLLETKEVLVARRKWPLRG